MRLFVIPLALLALGVLAALPFRRFPAADRIESEEPNSQGVPTSVSPLSEGVPAGDRDLHLQRTLGELARKRAEQLAGSQDNPYDLPPTILPQSYSDVAVPLVFAEESRNLLGSAAGAPATESVAQSQKYQIDHFGIPRPVQPLVASQSAVEIGRGDRKHSQWSQEALVGSPNFLVASDTKAVAVPESSKTEEAAPRRPRTVIREPAR